MGDLTVEFGIKTNWFINLYLSVFFVFPDAVRFIVTKKSRTRLRDTVSQRHFSEADFERKGILVIIKNILSFSLRVKNPIFLSLFHRPRTR